jgi:hypothetical protein
MYGLGMVECQVGGHRRAAGGAGDVAGNPNVEGCLGVGGWTPMLAGDVGTCHSARKFITS